MKHLIRAMRVCINPTLHITGKKCDNFRNLMQFYSIGGRPPILNMIAQICWNRKAYAQCEKKRKHEPA